MRDGVGHLVAEWRERGAPYEMTRLITAPVRHGFVRLTVEQPENLPASGPAIVVANHISFFDSVLLMFGWAFDELRGVEASNNRRRRPLTDQVMGEICRLTGQRYVNEFAHVPHAVAVSR
jgi:Acyltransferase